MVLSRNFCCSETLTCVKQESPAQLRAAPALPPKVTIGVASADGREVNHLLVFEPTGHHPPTPSRPLTPDP